MVTIKTTPKTHENKNKAEASIMDLQNTKRPTPACISCHHHTVVLFPMANYRDIRRV